jgi:hypothetical protein
MKQSASRRTLLAIATGTAILLAIAGGLRAAGEQLNRSSMSAGGGVVSGGGLTLRTGIGVPVAGTVSNGSLTLCTGVVCDDAASQATEWGLFLPAVRQ